MEKYNVKFHSMREIEDFVQWIENVPGECDISSDNFNIDAKSFMGIIVLGLDRELTLSFQKDLSDKDKAVLDNYSC
jgi:phosphotransferase system HPr-like phosphotransfer protein